MKIEEIIEIIVSSLSRNRDGKKNNWSSGGKYVNIKILNNDDTGEVGELLLNDIFTKYKYKVEYEKAITHSDKYWDIVIDGIKIEVKTATIGSSTDTFQHEKFFQNREYDAFMFLDFTPNDLYVVLARKEDINWDELTKRMVNGIFTSEYKFDLSLLALKRGETPKLKDCFISRVETEKDMTDLFDKFNNKYYKKK
jgi:hypothetical protein